MISWQSINHTMVTDTNRSRAAVEIFRTYNNFLFLSPSLSYFITYFASFIYFRRVSKQVLRHICLSVRSQVCIKISLFPIDGFSWNSIFTNIYRKKWVWLNSVKTSMSHICEFLTISHWIFPGLWKSSVEFVEKTQAKNSFCSAPFFPEIVPFARPLQGMQHSRRAKIRIYIHVPKLHTHATCMLGNEGNT